METPTLEVGRKLPPYRIAAVDPQVMAAWAGFLRDPNPIHLDREAVRATGLGDKRINQGPINVAWILNMLAAAFPGGQVISLDNRFVGNVFEDDAVAVTGEITAVDGKAGSVRCALALAVEGKGDVLVAEAVVRVARALSSDR